MSSAGGSPGMNSNTRQYQQPQTPVQMNQQPVASGRQPPSNTRQQGSKCVNPIIIIMYLYVWHGSHR